MVDQFVRCECCVGKPSEFEPHHGNVDQEVLLPAVAGRGIGGDESDEENALGADGDEEVHRDDHDYEGRWYAHNGCRIYLWRAVDSVKLLMPKRIQEDVR